MPGAKCCFLTVPYKDHWIHSYYDPQLKRDVVTIQKPDYTTLPRTYKSCDGAKRAIRRMLKS